MTKFGTYHGSIFGTSAKYDALASTPEACVVCRGTDSLGWVTE